MHDIHELPAPSEGVLVTLFLVVRDVAVSTAFYSTVLGGRIVRDADPAMVRLYNSWIIMNPGGGPTPDKPRTTLVVPDGIERTSAFLTLRVADIARCHEEWRGRGARFLTEPKPNGHEIRCYMVDPDDHLIEVGQAL